MGRASCVLPLFDLSQHIATSTPPYILVSFWSLQKDEHFSMPTFILVSFWNLQKYAHLSMPLPEERRCSRTRVQTQQRLPGRWDTSFSLIAKRGPDPGNKSPAYTASCSRSLTTLAKFQLVWRRLCDIVQFRSSCLFEHTLTAFWILPEYQYVVNIRCI